MTEAAINPGQIQASTIAEEGGKVDAIIRDFTPGAAGIWALLAVVLVAVVKVWPMLRKLSIDENAGIRAEYVNEMKALRQEVRDLRTENDALRREIRELYDAMAGIRRQALSEQMSVARVLAEEAGAPVAAQAFRKLGGEA